MVLTATLPADSMALVPGTYTMRATVGGVTEEIGYLDCMLLRAPPLTEERKVAIRANALAAKAIRLDLACSTCRTGWKAYAALDRDDSLEAQGFSWYESLPPEGSCDCAKLKVDLSYIRSSLHGFLGIETPPPGQIELVPMYHRRALQALVREFTSLLDTNPKEERVQQFLSAHPVILSQFGATWLLPKAPILTMHFTDFALLNHRRELVLIEIERPSLKLMPQKGGPSAELQTPVRQLNDWFHEIEEHRAAALACMKLLPTDVAGVRGVVIAGRNKDYDREKLRKLRKWDFGRRIELLTYDDLINGFVAIIKTLTE